MITPPVFWTEVFSRPDSRWIPVDPIRCIVNKRKVFDPSSFALQQRTLSENRMVYVLAFEEDGYARDVTRRYAREYGAKVAKVQLGGGAGKGGRAKEVWWQGVLGAVTRPYRLVCGPGFPIRLLHSI
jgi:xeroderma pigmentosum group C-complementing protein